MSDQTLSEMDFLRDLQSFVSEKWQGAPCDRCGTRQWSILPGNANALNLTARTPRGIDPRADRYPTMSSHGIEFIPIYCDNCGNTVIIYAGVFDEWRKAHRRTT